LVEPEAPESLANAIISFLQDSTFRENVGMSGRAWVVKNYSRTHLSRKISDAASVLWEKKQAYTNE